MVLLGETLKGFKIFMFYWLLMKRDFYIVHIPIKRVNFSSVPRLSGWSFQATYLWGNLYPLRILLAKLGAAATPIDKLPKDSALPPVLSEKRTLFFMMTRAVGFLMISKEWRYHGSYIDR